MAKALYRKWRPQNWDEVVAQEHVIRTLRNAVMNERVAHAYLFAGPRGTGKTTSARLLAKAVNCQDADLKKRPCNQCEHCLALNAGRFMDLIEIDAASNTSVDDVRDLREKINFSPSQGDFKVYIIDEVHMLSTAAFNALLKTLEEPPPHAIFILATTEIHKIPATVLSRCQRHEFRRIPVNIIVQHLKDKSDQEDLHVDEPVFVEIARQATGSLRDAISLLDQLTSTTESITLEMAQNVLGTATSMRVIEIIDALIAENSAEGLSLINRALDSGSDPRQLARQIVTYLRNVLLYKMGNNAQVEVAEDVKVKINEHASQFTMPQLLQAIEAFNKATIEEHANWHPGLGLELAFTTYLAEPQQQASRTDQPAAEMASNVQSEKLQPAQSQPSKPKKVVQESPKKPETLKKQPKAEKVQPNETVAKEQSAETPVEPPASGEAPPSGEAPSSGESTLQDIHRDWKMIKSKVGKHNPRTEGLLNTSKIAGLKENTLILGFSSATLKEMMEKEGNITLTADILEEVYKQPMLVKCIVTTREGSTLPADLEIEKDGMVGTATRDLGGKISSAKQAE